MPSILKVEDVQKLLRIGRRQAYELVKQEGFPVIRLGRSIRVPAHAFFEWLRTQTEEVS